MRVGIALRVQIGDPQGAVSLHIVRKRCVALFAAIRFGCVGIESYDKGPRQGHADDRIRRLHRIDEVDRHWLHFRGGKNISATCDAVNKGAFALAGATADQQKNADQHEDNDGFQHCHDGSIIAEMRVQTPNTALVS